MVTVYFATNRNLIGTKANPDFGPTFNPDGPYAVRFGRAEVTGKKLDRYKIDLADEVLFTEEKQEQKLGSREIYQQILHKMRKHSRDTLAYVHGFGFSFKETLSYAAELKTCYSRNSLNVFVFSWPGDGEMVPFLSYYRDRDDAKASGAAIARTFLKLRDFLVGKTPEEACNQRLHLLAHSMGNYALRHAIQDIRSEIGNEIPRLFDNVFLVAADEDDDALEHDHKMRLLPRMGRMVHLYFNPDDRALLISNNTKGNPDRLGSDGPRLVDDLPRKVVLIDCKDVGYPGDDIQVHQYYRKSLEVIADINAVLAGQAPDQVEGRHYTHSSRSYRIVKSRVTEHGGTDARIPS